MMRTMIYIAITTAFKVWDAHSLLTRESIALGLLRRRLLHQQSEALHRGLRRLAVEATPVTTTIASASDRVRNLFRAGRMRRVVSIA